MSKYIPAVKVIDHFSRTKAETVEFGSEYYDSYQEALTEAVRRSYVKKEEKPITRIDGLEYRDKKVTPIVLKEVVMEELL